MSHLVPTIDYSGSPDPIAAIHAARLDRQRRIAAAAWAPPPPPPPPPEPARQAVQPIQIEDLLQKYRLAVNTFDPVIRLARLRSIPQPIAPWPAAVAIVCRDIGAKPRDMTSRRRFRNVGAARQTAFWLLRNCTPLSFPAIGRAAGGFDHSTIITACQRVERRRAEDPAFRDVTARMRDELSELLA